MNNRILVFALGILLLWPLAVRAESAGGPVWRTPVSLGTGSEPIFQLDPRQGLSVMYVGEDRTLQSRRLENGGWGKPERVASGFPERALLAFDRDGSRRMSVEQGGEIAVSTLGPDGAVLKREVIVEKRNNDYLLLLHYSIDGRGVSHLLYGRTPHYDHEFQNPGSELFYRRSPGSAWDKELLVTPKMSLSRTWQTPGVAVGREGRVFVCSYKDLFSFAEDGAVKTETCPLPDFGMPVAMAAQGTGTLHIVYHPFSEDKPFEANSLLYVKRQDGAWGKPVKIGSQPGESRPALVLTSANELYAAWEGPDGELLVSMLKVE